MEVEEYFSVTDHSKNSLDGVFSFICEYYPCLQCFLSAQRYSGGSSEHMNYLTIKKPGCSCRHGSSQTTRLLEQNTNQLWLQRKGNAVYLSIVGIHNYIGHIDHVVSTTLSDKP